MYHLCSENKVTLLNLVVKHTMRNIKIQDAQHFS